MTKRFTVDWTPKQRTAHGRHMWDYRCENRLAKVNHISHGCYRIVCIIDNDVIETKITTNRQTALQIAREWVTS